MVQLLEMIAVEIGEEARRTDGMRRDVEIVDVAVPVVADASVGRSGAHECLYYKMILPCARAMPHPLPPASSTLSSSAAACTGLPLQPTRQVAASASRSLRRTISAPLPPSITRRRCTAGCDRCSP